MKNKTEIKDVYNYNMTLRCHYNNNIWNSRGGGQQRVVWTTYFTNSLDFSLEIYVSLEFVWKAYTNLVYVYVKTSFGVASINLALP